MTLDFLGHDFNPLFILLETKEWKTAISHVNRQPHSTDESIKLKGFYNKKLSTRVNALHIACNNQAPLEVIEALVKANPNRASEKESSYQRLPLHIATLNQSNPRVVGALVKACPRAARVQDIHGRLAIHYASKDLLNGERMLRYLIKVYPESVKIADDKGFLPLHVACRSGMPMPVIQMLLRVAPETILLKTKNGSTPVHCARSVKGKGETQELIVDTLMHFAKETKKLFEQQQQDDHQGHCSSTVLSRGTATSALSCSIKDSTASSVSVVSNLRCDYTGIIQAASGVVSASTRRTVVPEMINLSGPTSIIAESAGRSLACCT